MQEELDPWDCVPIRSSHCAQQCKVLFLNNKQCTKFSSDFKHFSNIEALWVDNNKLRSISGIDSNFRVKEVYARSNHITTLEGSLLKFKFLEVLLLSDNSIRKLNSVLKILVNLHNLKRLDLYGNPVADESDYRLKLIYHCPQIQTLDRHMITQEERNLAAQIVPNLNSLTPVAKLPPVPWLLGHHPESQIEFELKQANKKLKLKRNSTTSNTDILPIRKRNIPNSQKQEPRDEIEQILRSKFQAFSTASTSPSALLPPPPYRAPSPPKMAMPVMTTINHSAGPGGLHPSGQLDPWARVEVRGAIRGWLIDQDVLKTAVPSEMQPSISLKSRASTTTATTAAGGGGGSKAKAAASTVSGSSKSPTVGSGSSEELSKIIEGARVAKDEEAILKTKSAITRLTAVKLIDMVRNPFGAGKLLKDSEQVILKPNLFLKEGDDALCWVEDILDIVLSSSAWEWETVSNAGGLQDRVGAMLKEVRIADARGSTEKAKEIMLEALKLNRAMELAMGKEEITAKQKFEEGEKSKEKLAGSVIRRPGEIVKKKRGDLISISCFTEPKKDYKGNIIVQQNDLGSTSSVDGQSSTWRNVQYLKRALPGPNGLQVAKIEMHLPSNNIKNVSRDDLKLSVNQLLSAGMHHENEKIDEWKINCDKPGVFLLREAVRRGISDNHQLFGTSN